MIKIQFVYDRRKKSGKTGKGTIELELYFDRNDRQYISSTIEVSPSEWDSYVINRKDALELNAKLGKLKSKYDSILKEMCASGIEPSSASLRRYLHTRKSNYANFLEFMLDYIKNSDNSESTKIQHFVAYESLKRFGRIKAFTSLTSENIMLYDEFIKKEGKRSQTTIYGYHKRIKSYVLKAYQLGYIRYNPYSRVRIDRGKYRERKPLSENEIDKMINTDFGSVLNKVRDLFIFQIYTGLSYADTENLNSDCIVMVGGLNYIDGQRIKTKTNFYTPILPRAQKVLDKYNGCLPIITNQRYNLYLHVIEKALDLRKSLTSHIARHTFATTIALAHNVPIETVSRMLGHRDIRTTQIYAKVLKTTMTTTTD